MLWEMVHQKPWLQELPFDITPIDVDSTTAISIASRDEVTSRTKHISICYHHIRDRLHRNLIMLRQVSSYDQVANGLAKVATREVQSRMVVTPLLQK